jgi:hypothetical protein
MTSHAISNDGRRRSLGELQLTGEPLHLLRRQAPRVGEDAQLVALERRVREDVHDDIGLRGIRVFASARAGKQIDVT